MRCQSSFSRVAAVVGVPLATLWWWRWRMVMRARTGCQSPFGADSLEDVVVRLKENDAKILSHEGWFRSSTKVRLRYRVYGTGSQYIVVCNGVNCSHLLWAPLFNASVQYRRQRTEGTSNPMAGDEWLQDFSVVMYDYPGLFGSDMPTCRAMTSIYNLKEDVAVLADHLKGGTVACCGRLVHWRPGCTGVCCHTPRSP